jgi:hypothetical protein
MDSALSLGFLPFLFRRASRVSRRPERFARRNSADSEIPKTTIALLGPVSSNRVLQSGPKTGACQFIQSNETSRLEIFVKPFPAGEGKRQISVNGGVFPRWRRDGKELFYVEAGPGGKMVSVKINSAGTILNYDAPAELFDGGRLNNTHSSPPYPYDVSPDGQRFIIARATSPGGENPAFQPITVILNWTASLKR